MLDILAVIGVAITLLFAVLTIEIPDLLYATLCLCGMAITIGLLFGILLAPYVMFFQLLIYAGATITLFLTVIMLTKRRDS